MDFVSLKQNADEGRGQITSQQTAEHRPQAGLRQISEAVRPSAPIGVLRMNSAKKNRNPSSHRTVRHGKIFRLIGQSQATPTSTIKPGGLMNCGGMRGR